MVRWGWFVPRWVLVWAAGLAGPRLARLVRGGGTRGRRSPQGTAALNRATNSATRGCSGAWFAQPRENARRGQKGGLKGRCLVRTDLPAVASRRFCRRSRRCSSCTESQSVLQWVKVLPSVGESLERANARSASRMAWSRFGPFPADLAINSGFCHVLDDERSIRAPMLPPSAILGAL